MSGGAYQLSGGTYQATLTATDTNHHSKPTECVCLHVYPCFSALFGILFVDKQEAAFASYRMFYATGCAISFGYSFFLCVQTKVYILAGMLTLALLMYSVIEMKVQLQSQHIKDIVAF